MPTETQVRPHATRFSFFEGFKESSQEEIDKAGDFFMKYAKTESWNGYSPHFHSLVNEGVIRSAGYVFDMKPFLKKYLYRSYGSINVGYAPSKEALRNICHLSKTDSVVECPKDF